MFFFQFFFSFSFCSAQCTHFNFNFILSSSAAIVSEKVVYLAAKNIFAKNDEKKVAAPLSSMRKLLAFDAILYSLIATPTESRYAIQRTHLTHLIILRMKIACGKPFLGRIARQRCGMIFHEGSSVGETSERRTKRHFSMRVVVVVAALEIIIAPSDRWRRRLWSVSMRWMNHCLEPKK